MQEVKAVRNVYLAILLFNPGQLVNDFVAPLIHALVPDVHLRVQHPQEAKAFVWKHLNWNVYDLLITHCTILQVKLVIGEHVAAIISLCSFNSPWRIDVDDFKMSYLLNEIFQVEKSQIAIYECLWAEWLNFIFIFKWPAIFGQLWLFSQILRQNCLCFGLLRKLHRDWLIRLMFAHFFENVTFDLTQLLKHICHFIL